MKDAGTKVTGIVLAGGMGRRMGGINKGLLSLDGKPLVKHVIERFAPQVDELLINANDDLETYTAFGYPVISDSVTSYAGPLAGLQRGMAVARHPLVATAPCDSPFLPTDLVQRLGQALHEHGADFAVARTDNQPHPVFSLCKRSLLPNLTEFLHHGGRKVEAWYTALHHVEVPFDDIAAFTNINTPEELECLNQTA